MEITNSGVLSFSNGGTASFDTAAYIKKREKTVTGSTVSVSDAAAYPAVGLTVNITPVQEGSGTPSPDNIRPITGWTGVNIYQSGADTSEYMTIPVTFSDEAGTVYGGKLDVVNGTLTKNTGIITMTGQGSESYKFSLYVSSNTILYIIYLDNDMVEQYPKGMYTNGFLFNCAEMTKDATILTGSSRIMSYAEYGNYAKRCHLIVRFGDNFNFDTEAKANNWLKQMYNNGTPVQYCYPLRNPVTYQLAPTQIEMLLGDNSIWADTGDVSLTYRMGEEWYSADPTLSRSVSPILSMSRTSDIENDFELSDISEYDDEFEFKELDEAETEQKTERNTKKEW